jgi:chromosomal replication initiation ATPase DnaA
MVSGIAEGLLEKKLISWDILTTAELAEAKSHAEDQGGSLVKALIDSGKLSEEDLSALMADAYSVRTLKLEDVEIDRESIRHIPAAIAHRHKLVPIRRSGSTLVVAMTDPTDQKAWAALRGVTDFEIAVFVGRTDAIEHALYLHYGEPPQAADDATVSGPEKFEDISLIPDEKFTHIGRSIPLIRDYSFDTLIEDTGNQYALNHARAVVSGDPEERICPLYIWGKRGCGKTHVLHAIANYLSTRAPLEKFILTSCSQFADQLFESLSSLKVNLFRYFYRDAKYLLLDDCDILLQKAWLQDELAETIETIRTKGGWVVLNSKADLIAEPRLSLRLRHVLESGQIAQIGDFSPQGRARILEKQIGKINIPGEAISLLSAEFNGDMQDLQETLTQLAAITALESRTVSVQDIEDLLITIGSQTTKDVSSADGGSGVANLDRASMSKERGN